MVLNALRLNGTTDPQYILNNPTFYPVAPPIGQLTGFLSSNAVTRIDSNLQAPRIIQSAIGVDRQLPKGVTLSVNFTDSRGVHQLRSRNINAPLPGTYNPAVPGSAVYPFPGGAIDQYESSGLFKQNQLSFNVRAPLSTKISLFGYYVYGHAHSNTDGSGTFPANSYDESTEWGRAAFDVRNRVFMGGTIVAPWGIRLAPMIVLSSAPPFNITIGKDLNGYSPVHRPAGLCDRPDGESGGDSLGRFRPESASRRSHHPTQLRHRVCKLFGQPPGQPHLGIRGTATAPAAPNRGGGGGGGPRGGGFGGPRGGGGPRGPGMGGGMLGGVDASKRFNITASVQARNLLNTVNPGSPVGNLTSPLFGQSTSLAGGGFGGASQTANRRLDLQLRLTF